MKMWKSSYSIIILSIVIPAITTDIPDCDYFDTVDLKDSKPFKNGSYLYKDILIPKEKIGIYNYRKTTSGNEKTVDSYPRGCLCQVKSCVLFCCEPYMLIHNFAVNITLNNGTDVQVNEFNKFAVQVKFEISCDLLEDIQEIQGPWKLFEVRYKLRTVGNSADLA